MGTTSLRNSTLSNNIVAAVLRFEGRTWITEPRDFYEASQYLDTSQFASLPDTAESLYASNQKKKEEHLVRVSWVGRWHVIDSCLLDFDFQALADEALQEWKLEQSSKLFAQLRCPLLSTLPLLHIPTQAKKGKASQDASLFVRGCQLNNNQVFHGVLFVKVGQQGITVTAVQSKHCRQYRCVGAKPGLNQDHKGCVGALRQNLSRVMV